MLADNDLITRSLEYVTFLRPYDTQHLLTNFDYRFKKFQFEQRFRARRNAVLFVHSDCVKIFGIPTPNIDELVILVPSRWADQERSHLLFAPKPLGFAYYSTLALLK